MTRHALLWVAMALAVSACGPAPVPSPVVASLAPSAPVVTPAPTASPAPTAPPTPSAVPTTSLTLTTEIRERCGSIGGCATYVALTRDSEAPVWLALDGPGSYEPALPALIGLGSYTVRFRLAAVSDDIHNGAPAEETTIATCELPIEVFKGMTAVTISVTFATNSCTASGTATVEVID